MVSRTISTSPTPKTSATCSRPSTIDFHHGTVTASINGTTLGGIVLTQSGTATGTPSISEIGTGTTAAFLHLKGNFTNGTLDGEFPPTFPTTAVKGIGSTLSDLVTRFSDAQTGILFDASTALQSQETQLTKQQDALSTLLASKKQLLLTQFANLESTIAGLQAQGTADFQPRQQHDKHFFQQQQEVIA